MILRKLDDPDCMQIAEKELKSLIVNEIDNGEKLNTLIGCIADEKNYSSKKTQFNSLKLYISVAEIFQHQILEFLPKIFVILNKKIVTSDEQFNEMIADTYGGVIEFSFKGAEIEDANFVLTECLKQIFGLFSKNIKNVHICTGLCVSKILQCSEIEMLVRNFEDIYQSLVGVLTNVKERYTIIESILTLLLSVNAKVGSVADQLIDTLITYISDKNPKTRKMCIDTLYALFSIDPKSTEEYKEQIYDVLQELKSDKNKFVREAALECLKLLNVNKRKEKQEERIKSAIVRPDNSTQKRMKRKKSAKFVNKRLKLDHVKSTIDRSKMNKNFGGHGSGDFEMPTIHVKEPKVKIDYEEIQKEAREKYLQRKKEDERERSQDRMKIEKTQFSEEQFNPNHKMTLETSPMLKENHPEQLMTESVREEDNRNNQDLKKYIKVLNGKIKDLQVNYAYLNKTNVELQSKIEMLEKNQIYLMNFLQKNKMMNYSSISKEDTYQQNFGFAPPDSTLFFQHPPSQPQKTGSNKWLNRNNNINTKIYSVLATNNKDALFNFLRETSGINNFNLIDSYMKEQLYERLVEWLSRNANDDAIVTEYVLKWIDTFMTHELPETVEESKKIYALLFYLSSNLSDTVLQEKTSQLLKHDYFINHQQGNDDEGRVLEEA